MLVDSPSDSSATTKENMTISVYDSDDMSISSNNTELSALQIATQIEYSVIWELLHGCQEAAFTDIPYQHRDCLSIFNLEKSGSEGDFLTYMMVEDEIDYNKLLQLAGAVKTGSQPWALPTPLRSLSDEDLSLEPYMRVMSVSEVTPTAACFVRGLDLDSPHDSKALSAVETCLDITGGNADPLVYAKGPMFASTVFTSASHISPHNPDLSFQSLRRYNRLATCSVLRQSRSLGIEVPIFGVLLRENLIAIHIDWYEEHEGNLHLNSAFYPSDEDEMELKIWNINHPNEAREIANILVNIREYTLGTFTSRVRRGLCLIQRSVDPWKWSALALPPDVSLIHLRQRDEETSVDKVRAWRTRVQSPSAQMTSKDWLKRFKGRLQEEQPVKSEFPSPPSTPGGQ